jgi:hypothetical protein
MSDPERLNSFWEKFLVKIDNVVSVILDPPDDGIWLGALSSDIIHHYFPVMPEGVARIHIFGKAFPQSWTMAIFYITPARIDQ